MSHRDMRRKDRALPREEAMAILRDGEYGVLSTVGADGQPYGVALNYALDGEDGICFHCALSGHKIDNLRHEARVSFTVAQNVKEVYKADYTTLYESVVVFGKAAEITDEAEKARLLRAVTVKYFPDRMDEFDKAMGAAPVTGVWRVRIDHITGKANR